MRQLPTGVSPTKSGRFYATIKLNKRAKRIGTFDTPEQAHAAYSAAKPSKLPTGVYHAQYSRKFIAKVTYRGKRMYFGTFSTQEQAKAAYLAKKQELAELNEPKQV